MHITLNSEQKCAVEHIHGSLLIVAGAGSGKTRVITNRILFLMLAKDINPCNILALTFTNKAALEMKQRVQKELLAENPPFIGTFHAYCFLLLKKHNNAESFSILDSDDQEKLLKKIIQTYGIEKKFTPQRLSYTLSTIKCQINGHNESMLFQSQPLVLQIYQAYEQEKALNRTLDFDDILIKALALFKCPNFKRSFQQTIRHILVDEYQDTNNVQHELLKAMALDDTKKLAIDSVCAVGDQDQSIYSWRGATPQNMDHFIQDFGPTTIIKIEQNYRSIQQVLDTANILIQHNTQRHPKKLWSDKHAPHGIMLLTCQSEYQEADYIIHAIKKLQQKKPAESIALLYRTHAQSRTIEENLIKYNIPYTIIGGVEFYQRAEIKDILAYFKIINNPYDRISFFRIFNTPARGFGAKCQETLMEIWATQPLLDCFQLLEYAIKQNIFAAVKAQALSLFLNIFAGINSESDIETSLDLILEKTAFLSYIKKNYDPVDAENRIANIQELINAIKHFKQQGTQTIAHFLDEIALMQVKKTTHNTQNTVSLMTLHSAKGLEFDSVLIIGLEEQILPSARSTQQLESLEEERRLLYVGITRARNRLLLTNAKSRFLYGTPQRQLPSRFINEMKHAPLITHDVSFLGAHTGIHLIDCWIDNKPSKITDNSSLYTQPQRVRFSPSTSGTLQEKSTLQHETLKIKDIVLHATYGTGMITDIEKSNADHYIIVKFNKYGTKKILSSYLKKI